jgi:hypothetical protein
MLWGKRVSGPLPFFYPRMLAHPRVMAGLSLLSYFRPGEHLFIGSHRRTIHFRQMTCLSRFGWCATHTWT